MARLVVETITPGRAAELLRVNVGNRSVRPRAVNQYARDMAAGNWKFTGAPIVVNGERRLLDGQHRLLACVQADTSFETAVVYDADESIHFAIDKGLKRTVADELRWRGETDVHNLGAALNLLWQYEHGSLTDYQKDPSPAELVAFLHERPEIRSSIHQAAKVHRIIPIRIGAFAVAHYLISTLHGSELADTFADKVASGAELVQGDPALVLRNYATNVAANRNVRPRREEWLAVIIKAANYWLLGRPIKSLRWRRVGPAAEAFPTLVGPEETG